MKLSRGRKAGRTDTLSYKTYKSVVLSGCPVRRAVREGKGPREWRNIEVERAS